ncbi:hypothetical protein [Nocardia sputorum]|uniref:hypothetical protein n=1 Tax=Nocardia sputorum TaxID=2984338 RepID=UPI002492C1DD|nr:hypothetical protein [Nocardia sputorum]
MTKEPHVVYLLKPASLALPTGMAQEDPYDEHVSYIKIDRIVSKDSGWIRVRPIAPNDDRWIDLPPTSVAAIVIRNKRGQSDDSE